MSSNIDDNTSFQIDEFYLDLQQDGSKLKNLSEEEIIKNPFPGLRPFKTSEQDLFYGRKEQTNELIVKLAATNFLAVIGSSGTGKSSLVRAGLIPALFGGNIAYKGSDWKIAICRPGNDPIKNLSIALASAKAGSNDREKVLEENKIIEPLLRSSSYGILDVKELLDQQHNQSGKQNLLIIIDQFEELFRFDRKELKYQNILYQNIESDFVKLLLQCKSDVESIFVVITMRSEFLGDCVKFRGLPEAINKSQYLVPQLEREQLTKVIKGPVQRAGKKISPDLVEILINEIESEKLKENLDQLPILQHALMRTYDEAFKKQKINDEMLYEHYKKVGEMKGALARHAQEVFDKLDNSVETENSKGNIQLSRKQHIAKIIFQALTDATSDQKGGRRPTELQNIYDILKAKAINANEDEADEVINYFRHADTSFIMPPSNTKLYPALMLDISHESLMRNWPKLEEWMKEEVTASELYKRLNDNREQNDRDHDTYIGGSLLRDIQDWKNKELYNAVWAARYQKTPVDKDTNTAKSLTSKGQKESLYQRNLVYLQECQDKVEERRLRREQRIREEQIKEQEDRERKIKSKRNKLIATVSIFAATISIVFGVYAYTQGKAAKIAIQEKASADALKAKSEIERQKDLVKFQKQQAEAASAKFQQDRAAANAKAELAEANAKAIQAEANAQTARAEAEANAAKARTEAMAEAILQVSALVRNLTQDEFYRSDLLDVDKRNKYLDSLVALKYGESPDPAAFERLRSDLNNMAEIKYLVQTDPNVALLKAQQVYDSSESKLADSLLLDVANTNLFYSKRLEVSKKTLGSKQTPVAISKSRKTFAFKDADTIRLYQVNNNELSFIKNIVLKKDYFNTESESSIPALTFTDDYHLVAFTNTNDIYRVDTNGVISSTNIMDLLPGNDSVQYSLKRKHYTSAISADGETLALDYNDYNVILLKINEKNSNPQIIHFDRLDGYVDNIYASADGKNFIIRQGIKYKMYDAVNKRMLDVLNDSTSYANFSDDGKYVFAQKLNDSIYMYSPESEKTEKLNLFLQEKVSSITISPDQQKMIIKTGLPDYPNKVYYFEKDNSFASLNYKSTQKQLPYLKYSNIFFTGDDDLMDMSDDLYTYNQYIRLWKDYGKVTHGKLPAVLNEIPALTYDEKLKAGFIKYEDIEYSGDEATLLKSAEYYNSTEFYDSSSLLKAQELYQKLVTITTSSENKQNYLTKLTTINADLFKIDSNWHRRAADLKEIISHREKLVTQFPDSDYYKTSLSSNYWNLSWCQVFIDEYDSAVYSAKRGYELDTLNNGIITNLALGYLLSGQCEKANSVYETYKDKTYLTSEKKFTNAFLEDFSDLEKAGVITPNNKEVYAHVQKVTDYLNGKTKTLACK